MDSKISVLDINIDNCSAKEAMKRTVEYMGTEPVNIVEMATVNGLMQIEDKGKLKEDMCGFDLVLAGDKAILEAADVTDRKYLQETEGQVFLRMFMRYLHKNHKRIYLLVESEEEGQKLFDYLQNYYAAVLDRKEARMESRVEAEESLEEETAERESKELYQSEKNEEQEAEGRQPALESATLRKKEGRQAEKLASMFRKKERHKQQENTFAKEQAEQLLLELRKNPRRGRESQQEEENELENLRNSLNQIAADLEKGRNGESRQLAEEEMRIVEEILGEFLA